MQSRQAVEVANSFQCCLDLRVAQRWPAITGVDEMFDGLLHFGVVAVVLPSKCTLPQFYHGYHVTRHRFYTTVEL